MYTRRIRKPSFPYFMRVRPGQIKDVLAGLIELDSIYVRYDFFEGAKAFPAML
jgi:hypothetical protein